MGVNRGPRQRVRMFLSGLLYWREAGVEGLVQQGLAACPHSEALAKAADVTSGKP